MAGLMTYGRRQFEHLDATMRRLIPPFHAASAELTALVDADARAFQAYLVSAQRGGQLMMGGALGRESSCGVTENLQEGEGLLQAWVSGHQGRLEPLP